MAAQITNYQCPSCMAPLHYSGESGMLECEYCSGRFTIEEIEKYYAEKNEKAADNFDNGEQYEEEETYWDMSGTSSEWDGEESSLKSYICPSCAAELICDENTAATSCPYCGNPTVVPGQFKGDLKPDYVIPFRLSHQDAKNELKNFYKGKKFLPNEFESENKIDKLQGVYVPFWLYNCEAAIDATFDGVIVTSHRQGQYNVTTTAHYDIQRKGIVPFENIPVDASKNMPNAHMDAIEPFDYSQLKPFSMAYLPGYLAERYGETAEECIERVETRVENTAVDAMREDIHGYAGCTLKRKHINIRRGKVSYALMPVYMLTTRYNGEIYQFAMNGQTGKFVGNLPVSRKKYWTYFLGIAGTVTAVLGTVAMLLL